MTAPLPVLPDYSGASLAGLVPALQAAAEDRPAWLPVPLADPVPTVLLVVDGLGWHQLIERWDLAPALRAMVGGPITSVVPTTTATALSSIVLGCPPAVHGLVGYRLRVDGPGGDEILNVLRWRTASGDARLFVPPAEFQTRPAFGGRPVPVVSRSDFDGTGFSIAHQRDAPLSSWTVASSIAVEVKRLLAAGEPFVYAYYDGVDKVAHARGLGDHYDAELAAVDRLVESLIEVLPPGAVLAVTSDHGQVDVNERAVPLDAELLAGVTLISGEARFRWLHTAAESVESLAEAARARYGAEAWVVTVDEASEAGWYGGPLDSRTRSRLGDVAIVPFQPVGYLEPSDKSEHRLASRHGSLTAEEMWVPLLATTS